MLDRNFVRFTGLTGPTVGLVLFYNYDKNIMSIKISNFPKLIHKKMFCFWKISKTSIKEIHLYVCINIYNFVFIYEKDKWQEEI